MEGTVIGQVRTSPALRFIAKIKGLGGVLHPWTVQRSLKQLRAAKTEETDARWDHKPKCISKALIPRIYLSTLSSQLSAGLWVAES